MHLGGIATRSCVVPVSLVGDRPIVTIEGIGQDPVGRAVQNAWVLQDVIQCGYCQSGMMIAAVQLLAKNPNPSVAEIKDAFTNTPPSPHLCRCGTYAAIIAAIQRAAKAMAA